MATKKKKKEKPVEEHTIDSPYRPGDFLYYLDVNNKVFLAEVRKAFEENGEFCYEIVDQTSYKFVTVPNRFCHDDAKFLKKKKRENL